MNGRIYDPVVGRMITPDSSIPAPENLQAFNRYSYVYNNPLAFIDLGGLTPEQVAAASSGATAEGLNAANRAMADNTSAASIGNSGIAKYDGLSSIPGGGGGGDDPLLMPITDPHGNITGWSSGSKEEGDYQEFGLDEFSESDLADFKENWENAKAEAAKNADKESLTKEGPPVDDGTQFEENGVSVEGYDTIEEAGYAASMYVYGQDETQKEDREGAGWIVKEDGKYHFTKAEWGGRGTGSNPLDLDKMPKNCAAIYHSHGNDTTDSLGELFSGNDMRLAFGDDGTKDPGSRDRKKVPMFLITPKGNINVYYPNIYEKESGTFYHIIPGKSGKGERGDKYQK